VHGAVFFVLLKADVAWHTGRHSGKAKNSSFRALWQKTAFLRIFGWVLCENELAGLVMPTFLSSNRSIDTRAIMQLSKRKEY
jgi:hypothetical protein